MALNLKCWCCMTDAPCQRLRRGIIAPGGAYVCAACWKENEEALALYDKAVAK